MRTIILDSQLLKSIQKCAMYTNLQFNMNLREPDKPAPLSKGELIHHFFAAYYKHRMDSGNVVDWKDCANVAFDSTKPFSTTLNLPSEDINIVFRSLEQYIDHYKYEPLEVLAVENPFALTLYESEEEDLRIVYVGVIDLIARMAGQTERVWDHKSQSRKSDFSILDDQFEGYSTAADVDVVLINVLGLQTSLKPEDKFRRVMLSYPQALKDKWKSHVVYWVKQYLIYAQNEEWPENHQSCQPYGRDCQFLKICSSITPESRAWLIQSSFVVGEAWDPTSVLSHRD